MFEQKTITYTERHAKVTIPGGSYVRLSVNHSTSDPELVRWDAVASGHASGNCVRGAVKISTTLDDAMEEAEKRCKAAADLLARLEEMGR
jgi:hypothetical protein